MKPRPPTLREKRRYILAKAAPQYHLLDPKRIYFVLHDAITSLYGDAVAADVNMGVLAYESGHAIIRCTRGSEGRVETALATVTSVNGCHVAFHAIATSGTIHALRRRIRPSPVLGKIGECEVEGIPYEVYSSSRQKVDLFSKGIKNQETLYFTHEDKEVI